MRTNQIGFRPCVATREHQSIKRRAQQFETLLHCAKHDRHEREQFRDTAGLPDFDLHENHWGCSDARIDEIQAKARRYEIAGNIGSDAVENPAAYEHSLDYFWDFHGPNPYEPTGYQADY